jgi:glyoxylase-like metal-dependent hydrolase (beta-lactamase superfamily II)
MRALVQVADGVWTGPTVPGPLLNLVVVDDVVVDSGLRWSRGRVAGLLRGRDLASHVVTHAHADHLGSSAWLCAALGLQLAMGEQDADRFEGGRVDTVVSAWGRAAARALDPERARVDRRLREGDRVGSFRVLEAPGHSPGNLVLWREEDRVLVVGDGPVNLSRTGVRWLHLPRSLHADPHQARVSRRRLAELEPSLVVPVHGHVVRDPGGLAACAHPLARLSGPRASAG